MNAAPTLERDQAAALVLLASSPLAAEAAARHEAARAEQRRAIIERLGADELKARAVEAEASEAARKARDNLARLHRETYVAALAQHAAEIAESNASAHLERLGNRAQGALLPLGNGVLSDALAAVQGALRRTLGGVGYQQRRDAYGRITATEPDDDDALRRVARLRELAAELEALRRSPLAPAEIERRCAEVEAWLDAGMKLDAAPQAKPGLLARLLA